MSKRILHIGIAPKEYIHRRMLDIAKGIRRQGPNEPRVWFTSTEALARVFSKKNMMLIEIIRHSQPESVTELAKRVKSQTTNVLRSLKTLEEFDVIHFEDREGNRRAPRLNYDDIRIGLGGYLNGYTA